MIDRVSNASLSNSNSSVQGPSQGFQSAVEAGAPVGAVHEVYRKKTMADFPVTAERTGLNAAQVDQLAKESAGELDDLVILKDDAGQYFYRVDYAPSFWGRTTLGQALTQGALIPLDEKRVESDGATVSFERLTDVPLPTMVMRQGAFIGDEVPDELYIRVIQPKDPSRSTQLSIYGNVTDDGKCDGDYALLMKMKQKVGVVGSIMDGRLDMNADGERDEQLDVGDKDNQVSVIYKVRKDPL